MNSLKRWRLIKQQLKLVNKVLYQAQHNLKSWPTESQPFNLHTYNSSKVALSCPTKCCCFQIKCLEFSVCNFEIREGYLWVTDWRNVQLWTFLVLNAVIVHWSLCGFPSFFNFESASYDKNPQIVGQFNFGSRAFLSAFWLNGNKSYQKSYGVPLKVCGLSSKKVRACLPPLVHFKSSIR